MALLNRANRIGEFDLFQEALGEYQDLVVSVTHIDEAAHPVLYKHAEIARGAARNALLAVIETYCAAKIAQCLQEHTPKEGPTLHRASPAVSAQPTRR